MSKTIVESTPSVFVLVAGKEREINFGDYTNVTARLQSEGDLLIGSSEFFNKYLQQASSYDLCVFMNDGSNFVGNAFTEIVETAFEKGIFGGVYTDNVIVDYKGNTLYHKQYPSYDARLAFNKFIYNAPLFVKPSMLRPFDQKLSFLNMWDAFFTYCRMSMLYHIPKPIVSMIKTDDYSSDITKEFKAINDKIQTTQ